MQYVSFRLFGRFDARYDSHPLTHLENTKTQELVCYLLLNGDRQHHREVLAGLLWGDVQGTQPRKYLRQALWHVQSAFRSAAGAGDTGLLVIDPDWIRLDGTADVWVDVVEFGRAFMTVRDVPGHNFDAAHAAIVRSAIDLYTGDLLEGWYQDWCQDERRRLQSMYFIMVDKLASYCESQRMYDMGIHYASHILRLDRAHERTHRRLMRLYYLSGDRTAALRQYQRCCTSLTEELGVSPSRETEDLHRQVAAQDLHGLVNPRPMLADESTSLVPNILQHLKVLQELVGQLHRQE